MTAVGDVEDLRVVYRGDLTEGQVWLLTEKINCDSDEDCAYYVLEPGAVLEVLKTFDYSTTDEPVVVLELKPGDTRLRPPVAESLHVVPRRQLENQILVWDPIASGCAS